MKKQGNLIQFPGKPNRHDLERQWEKDFDVFWGRLRLRRIARMAAKRAWMAVLQRDKDPAEALRLVRHPPLDQEGVGEEQVLDDGLGRGVAHVCPCIDRPGRTAQSRPSRSRTAPTR